MILGIHHTAIATPDIERLARFYCDNFGLQPIVDDGWSDVEELDAIVGLPNSAARFILLYGGNQCLELFQYSSPATGVPPPDRPVSAPGLTHICFAVDDIVAEHARLSAAGMTFHAPPKDAGDFPLRATYGRDPDGNVVELLQISREHPFNYRPTTPRWLEG